MARNHSADRTLRAVARRIADAGGRPTEIRSRILSILLAARRALTHADIEGIAASGGDTVDRVTLYRVLDWLVVRGLAHKVSGADRIWRFNAVSDESHEHAHFHCRSCGQVFCLADLKPASLPMLPRGFRFEHAELTIAGSCPHCAAE